MEGDKNRLFIETKQNEIILKLSKYLQEMTLATSKFQMGEGETEAWSAEEVLYLQ